MKEISFEGISQTYVGGAVIQKRIKKSVHMYRQSVERRIYHLRCQEICLTSR